MDIVEKLIEFIWNREYLSDTQKDRLETDIKNLLSKQLESDVAYYDNKFQENLTRVVDQLLSNVFGLKIKDLTPNDVLKVKKIIKEASEIAEEEMD